MKSRAKFIGWSCFGVGAMAFYLFVVRPDTRAAMVRPKMLYVTIAFRALRADLTQSLQTSASFSMPPELPDYYQDQDDFGGREIVHWQAAYADPFDQKKRSGATMLDCDVRQEGRFNGDPVDFRFRGNKLKYTRVNDRCAILYSFGPDEDDDLGAQLRKELADLTTETAARRLGSLTYDPTNGSISNGDWWNFLQADGKDLLRAP